MSFSTVAFAQTSFENRIYEAFVLNNMNEWKAAIDEMEDYSSENVDFLPELINYEYGYIGWCLGTNKKKQAKHYLELMEKNLEIFKENNGTTALYHAYMAAAIGFKIGLSNWRAPLLGPKSMNHAEQALENDSLNFQANTEMGNIWNHMPAVFGGSNEKALKYYQKAINSFEKSADKLSHKKWLYLNLIAISGQLEFEQKNYSQALQLYKKALTIEPGFKWVKNELLPELNKETN
ncbi:MAG: hypothetical protein ACOCU7_03815 [Tangfeifania sp.]